MNTRTDSAISETGGDKAGYNNLLLLVAGLGGLLYGVDVGIIAGALPYLEATSGLTPGQLSIVVAAVLLGSVFSTLFAGMLSDLLGRKPMMVISGVLFVISIPIIALAHGFTPLVLGRLLQGVSAGLIGVVIPLYLAECLGASNRGKGAGIFQWLLTLGIVVAAVIGFYFSIRVDEVAKRGNAEQLFAFKDKAWRSIFWVSLPPGILFVIGSFLVAESPRWLFRHGRKEAARAALRRSQSQDRADTEIREMEDTTAAKAATVSTTGEKIRESLLHRKYVVPFVLACIILAFTQATGINSIIGYSTTILIQSGLSDTQAHLGYVILTAVCFLMTMGGIALVDRKGRKFLISLGTAGITVSLICIAMIFRRTEAQRVDCRNAIQAMVNPVNQNATVTFNQAVANGLLATAGDAGKAFAGHPSTLTVIYSYGGFRTAANVVRSNDPTAKPIEINRANCLPGGSVEAFFKNPFASLDASKTAPLKIENALIMPVPTIQTGWLTASCIFACCAFFSIGPGVCVWLALSELMPTRIRSNGMSIALLGNQVVSTTIAAIFLPTVGKYGYSTMFFAFAGCTVLYFVTATFFVPETKGKTLEEIEEHFEGRNLVTTSPE